MIKRVIKKIGLALVTSKTHRPKKQHQNSQEEVHKNKQQIWKKES